MDHPDDHEAKHGRARPKPFARASRILHAQDSVKNQVVKRAQRIKAVIKDLTPYPGND